MTATHLEPDTKAPAKGAQTECLTHRLLRALRFVTASAIGASTLLVPSLASAAPATSAHPTISTSIAAAGGDRLANNEVLSTNQSIYSKNRKYRLTMQSDGNLVLYGPSGALWASRTAGVMRQLKGTGVAPVVWDQRGGSLRSAG